MKKRIFVAIEISDEARLKAAAYIKNLRTQFSEVRASWDKPEKLHLTMKFLGEISEAQLGNLIDACEKTVAEISPFKLGIGGTGVFPSARQARVLWLGVKDERGKLRRLNDVLESEGEKQGFQKEKRSFKAHLTVARLKEKSNELAEAHLNGEFEPVEFEVSGIVVFQSELKPTGSIYSVISRHKFTGMKEI